MSTLLYTNWTFLAGPVRWTIVPSMWFWSVSWSTNCRVYFSIFLVDQRKICPVSFENVVLVSLLADQLSGQFLIFWKRLDKKFKRVNKKDLILDNFFWSTKKKLLSLREFLVSLWIFFGQALIFWYTNKKFWYTKKNLGGPKKIRAWPKIPWDWTIFFWSTIKREK